MNKPTVLILCNALDDATRTQRRISSDSPAASRKIFGMAQALQNSGVQTYILSLGRGSTDGSSDSYEGFSRRIHGIPTIYAPFSHRALWSKVLSLFGLLGAVARLAKCENRTIIFYNRLPAYFPILLTAKWLGYRCYLDLEDGEVSLRASTNPLRRKLITLKKRFFDRNCSDGALLACSSLSLMTKIRPVRCYYGTVADNYQERDWASGNLKFLMSGTLSRETGAEFLIECIRKLRSARPQWSQTISFEVTGKGEYLPQFERLAAEPGLPKVIVHGRLLDKDYKRVLGACHVGLALKPVGGILADTTFPSKVIEFASSGMLVLSTDVSDVKKLFGDGAVYIENSDADAFIEKLAGIAGDRQLASTLASAGNRTIRCSFSVEAAGTSLRSFLLGDDL